MNSEYEQRGDSEYEKRGCSHYYKLLWVMFQSVKCTCSSCDHVTMLTVCSCDHVLEFLLRTPSMMRQESPFTKIIIWLIPMLYLYGSLVPLLHNQILADTVECTLGELIMYITTYEKFHLNKRQVWAYFPRYALVICILCFHECKFHGKS